MNNLITVTNPEGKKIEVEVLDIFTVVGYDDKDYIMYTTGRKIDENNIEVFISILRQEDDKYILENIADENEWEEVQKAIDEMGELV